MKKKGPNNITRAIIDATVDRGIREVAEDPQRSIRKLADMGRKYTKGRFMQNIMELSQEMLRNEDCPYYDAIAQLLRNTDRKTIKHVGINIGYNSLTYGGKIIREQQKKRGYRIPWTLIFCLNNRTGTGLQLADLHRFIGEANDLGIFTFLISLEGTLTNFEDLSELFRSYSDSAFIFFLPDQKLLQNHLPSLKKSTNTMFLFRCGGQYTSGNIAAARKEKVFYGAYLPYNDSSVAQITEDVFRFIPESYQTAFVISVPEDNCNLENVAKMAAFFKYQRMKALCPFIPFDLYGDAIEIDRIVASEGCYCAFFPDGSVRTADEAHTECMLQESLDTILRETMGALD